MKINNEEIEYERVSGIMEFTALYILIAAVVCAAAAITINHLL
jgi:hypothetical protein